MSLKILHNSEIIVDKWNTLLLKSPYGSVFQTYGFYEMFNLIHGISAEAFAVENNDVICALCVVTLQKEKGIKGFFSRRAIVYGGPVLETPDIVCLTFLIEGINEYFKHKVVYLEIRNLHDYSFCKTAYINQKWIYLPYQNFLINCSDKDQIFACLGNNRKRQIKKALKEGVIIKEAESLKDVNQFYSILHNLYIKKIGKPLPPRGFFEEFFLKKIGIYLLVVYENSIIGGIMCPVFQKKRIYELYICGLDDEYKNQFPSVIATWSAIEYAVQKNIQIFDFMGAGLKDNDYGVREFKARFGGEPVEYGRYLMIYNRFLFILGKLALRVLSYLRNK